MPASSDGGQGLQNQRGNYQNVNINNQTQRQRRPVGLSFPIQEGFQGGQATINDETESDAGSLLYDNNFAGIQATPSFQQPALSENTRGHSLPSTSPVQSASGFSGVSMNIPSGGHLRPLQSYNEELVATDVDLQSLKRKLKQELGNKYEKDVANCDRTFNGTTLSDADVSKCSSQLLYYLGDNAVKCMICKQAGNIGTIFRHEERCIVGICSQRVQDMRQSNLPNRTEGDINNTVLPFNIRQNGELQDRAARGQTYGATGGFFQAGGPPSGETSYKAPYIPGSHQTCSESSFFTGGYATAPGPPPNRTAQNVHLPPEIPGSSTRFPFYQRHDRRLETFQNWQYSHVQCPKALTDAGFFYRETDDECQCFECGQVLRKWKVQDNPWTEHARHSPDCPFVMREKGQAFVNEVRKNTAKEEIKIPPTSFNMNTGRSEASPQRSDQDTITEDHHLMEMGYTEDEIQRAKHRFRRVYGCKKYTTERLVELLISDGSQQGNVKDLSICNVCKRRKVRVSQLYCGHIVCCECAAQPGDLCRICHMQVEDLVLFDAASLKK